MKALISKHIGKLLFGLSLLSLPFAAIGQIGLNYGGTAEELSQAITGNGIQIINPQITCSDSAYGSYSITTIPDFTEGEGIILSTGNIQNIFGPNDTEAATTIYDAPGDPLITTIAGNNSFDACVLEFDIVPVGDTLRFNFTFASEEYDEYVGTPFNDVFGFFISGPGIAGDPGLDGQENIALIPGTATPVGISTVNNGNPDIGFPPTNPEFYFANPLGLTALIQYDGWTQDLFAEKVITACDTFSLKLVIADVADPEWDSAVLIEAIQSNNISLYQTTQGGIESTIEGCNEGTVTFTRTPVTDQPAEVTFFVQGTAINGTDYQQIGDDPDPLVPKTITIPANQASADIQIIPFDDGLDEGEEFIDIFVGNPDCVGTVQDSIRVLINDSIAVSIDPPLAFVCLGDSLTFDVESDENANFTWSPPDFLNETDIQEPTTTPTSDVVYTLTVTAASCQSVAISEIFVSDVNLSATTTDVACNGDDNGSIDLTISGGESPFDIAWTGPNGFTSELEDLTGLEPGVYAVLVTDRDGCTDQLSVEIFENDSIQLELSSPVFNGGFNISCANANDGQATVEVSGGTPPYEFEWNDPANQTTQTATGLEAGTYEVTVTDDNGCIQTGEITLNEPDPVTGILEERIDVLCTNEATGEITISAAGGVGPYTINWNTVPPQSGPTITGLIAGFYTAEITDINGCTGSIEIEIVEPDEELSGFITTTQAQCADSSDGSATANITGGSPPYIYEWSPQPGLNQPSIDDLTSGSYTLLITDDNGCTLTLPFNIAEPASISIDLISEMPPACNGTNDGSLTVSASGGTAPYTYSWDTTPVQTGPTINNLGPGVYTVSVTDANGCLEELAITLNEPDVLEVESVLEIGPTCNGGQNGDIEVSASGGTPPYEYTWNTIPPTSGPLLQDLGVGTYQVEVVDANGCDVSESFELFEPDSIEITIESIQNVLCAGESTGEVTISVTGGTPPYNIEWDDPANQTGLTASNLAAGTYIATVNDAFSCEETIEVTITEPDQPLDAQITAQTNVGCFGEATGSATVTVTGGSGSYTFQWDDPNSQQTSTATGLTAGTYTVTVFDNNGCATPATAVVTITEAPLLELTLTPSAFGGGFNVACADDSTATIDLTINGGTAPYSVLWNLPGLDTSTDEDLSDLAPGTYSVTVTDDNGCEATDEITLVAPEPIEVESETTPSLCFGVPEGSIDITISGGVPGYTASWTGPNGFVGSGTNLTNLEGGVYELTVEDANGCIFLDAVTVVQPDDLVITVDSLSDYNGFNTTCWNSADGEIYITPSGGTPPYSYQWNTAGNPNFSNQQDVINLTAGTYEAVLIDDNGCVQNEIIELIAPDTLDVDFILSTYSNGFNISCFGAADGTIEAVPTNGAPPFTFTWVGPNGFGPVFDNPITDLEAGEYSVLIQDGNGCSATETTALVEPEEFTINLIAETINGNNISCEGAFDGAINLVINGGFDPIDISWTGPNGFSSTDEDLFGLEAGEYCVVATDDNGCSENACITLTEPPALSVTLSPFVYGNGANLTCAGAGDGSIDAEVFGGTTPYAYSWTGPGNFTSTNEDIVDLDEGEYCLTVTDANGCETTVCTELIAPDAVDIDLVSLSDVNCNGEATGSIDIDVITGVEPLTFSWTGPNSFTSADEDISSLAAGTYCVTVTDDDGCVGEACYVISETDSLEVTFAVSSFQGGVQIDCAGNANGFINTAVSGGTAPYTYNWTGPDSFTSGLPEIQDLGPGTYCLELTDDNGCVFNQCIDILEPDTLTADPSITTPDCADGSLAEVDLQVSGGTPPYAFNWSNELTTEIVELDNGTYSVIITDANGCSAEETIEISLPEPILIGFDVSLFPGGVNVDCNGGNTGSIDLTAVNGTGILTYDWTGPNSFISNDEDLMNLEAGEYCVTVTDELGCLASGCVTLTEPAPLSASFEVTPTTCDSSNGALTISVSGGVPIYGIAWTGPDGFSGSGTSISNLQAGTYCADVSDANGCLETFCADVTGPDPIVISLTSPESGGFNIACFGDNSGSIETSISGGIAPYDFSWTGPNGYASSEEDLIDLFAGEYCLTVTDATGCVATECITLTQAPGIDYTFDVFEYPNGLNTSCGDVCDGSIDLTISGGTPPIDFAWTGPPGFSADTEDISDLCAGTYTVTTTDGNGCVQSASISVVGPEPIDLMLEAPTFGGGLEVSCFGENTGSIITTVSGGSGDLTFSWSGPDGFTSNLEDLENLFAGTYDLLITDENGCTAQASIELNEPASPLDVSANVFEFPSGDNISCPGADDGSIETVATGGTSPYNFNWNGPDGFVSSESSIESLAPGEYTLVVEDANSCVTTLIFDLIEPADTLEAELEIISEILCTDSASGALSVTATGGSPDTTIIWIGPNDFTSTEFEISQLPPGTYSYAVSDINGCSVSGAVTLSNPAPIVLSAEITQPFCEAETGSIDLSVSGGTSPYEYLWDDETTDQDLTDLGEGTYSVTVTDANGCTIDSTFTLDPENNLILNETITPPDCFGEENGAIEISVESGAEPVEFIWTGPDGFSATGDFIMNISAGTYTLAALDNNGCSVIRTYDVVDPDSLFFEAIEALVYTNGFNLSGFESGDGIIREPEIEGGTEPLNLFYEGPDGFTASGFGDQGDLAAGWYILTVTDQNQCTAVDSIFLTQPLPIELPNGISPNGDLFNDDLQVRGLERFPNNKLMVFNRWGNVVYEEDNYRNTSPWAGTNESGEQLPEGTYFVVVELEGRDNLKGYLELRR